MFLWVSKKNTIKKVWTFIRFQTPSAQQVKSANIRGRTPKAPEQVHASCFLEIVASARARTRTLPRDSYAHSVVVSSVGPFALAGDGPVGASFSTAFEKKTPGK